MNPNALTLREYTVYIIPGSIWVYSILSLIEPSYDLFKLEAGEIVALILIGGYVGGLITAAIFEALTAVLWFRQWKKDPLGDRLVDLPRDVLSEATLSVFKKKIEERFELEDVSQDKTAVLMWTALRAIEIGSPTAAEYIYRIVALENMCRSLSVALLFLSGSFLYPSYNWPLSLASFSVAMLLLWKVDKHRIWMVRTVVRSFIALETDTKKAEAA